MRKILKKNINQLIREVRLKQALVMLQNEEVTASQVAYSVGFSSPAYFNACFHEYFGLPPGKVKKEKLKAGEVIITVPVTSKESQEKPGYRVLNNTASGIILIAGILIITGIIVLPKIFNRNNLAGLGTSDTRISIVVMPFPNLTKDITLDIWQDWIQDEMITYLSDYQELGIRDIEAVRRLIQSRGYTNYASITPDIGGIVST